MSLALDIRQKSADLWHMQRVKRLVRHCFTLGPHVLIRVADLPCMDENCPEPVTQISVTGLDLTHQVIVVHRPLAEVSAADIADAAQVRP
ncbi:MAG: hypothetical protein EA407_04075 [Rhodobacteraceae bacterium]|nr:MAG: hypothetical protein EA407_04075 [Paracoccaceae bacterium]